MPGMPGMPAETSQSAPTTPSAPQKTTAEVPSLQISPEKQQLIGVKTVEVSLKPLEKVIRTVGRIDYDEKKAGYSQYQSPRLDRKTLCGLYRKICKKRRAAGGDL